MLQHDISQTVTLRGFGPGRGEVLDVFAARQLAKLVEEVAELAGAFARFPLAAQIEPIAREISERHNGHLADIDQAMIELADVQVVVFCLAETLARLSGTPFDVVDAALDKAQADVVRGIS